MVPQSLLNTIEQKQKEQTAPLTTNLVRLRGEMDEVLRDDASSISDDEKAKAYTQSLQRYLAYKEQQNDNPLAVKVLPVNSPVATPQSRFSDLEEEIIHSAPVNLKTRAKLLLKKLKANSDVVSWNNNGEVSFGSGDPLKGSNILDLTLDSLRERKTVNKPIGWEKFTKSMASINIPEHYVGNPKNRRALQEFKQGNARNFETVEKTFDSDDEHEDSEVDQSQWKKPRNTPTSTTRGKHQSIHLGSKRKFSPYGSGASPYKTTRTQRAIKKPKWISL